MPHCAEQMLAGLLDHLVRLRITNPQYAPEERVYHDINILSATMKS
jgi:hypothetical protein